MSAERFVLVTAGDPAARAATDTLGHVLGNPVLQIDFDIRDIMRAKPEWRNWQTRRIQNPMPARA